MKVFDASMRLLARYGAGAWAAAALLPAAALAAPAAHVAFSVGDVQVIAPNGQTRAATKGLEVSSGETVNTNGGRAQLRFTDGAFVSLQPQSAFRIDDYRFDGKADGKERGFFSLLKGGLRTITGLVGRTNRKNYQVNTAVATIGIRGTEYTIAYTNSISGSVGEGEIEVCTTRCVAFASGESFFVANPQADPQLTFKKTDLPPAQPDETRQPSYVANDNVDPNGVPSGLLMTGTWDGMSVADNGDGLLLHENKTVVFSSTGIPLSIDGNALPSLGSDRGNRDFLAWGREDTTTGYGYFFITGPQMLPSDLDTLKLSQPVGNYTLVGGTNPIGYVDGKPVQGQLLGGTLTAYFGEGKVDASLSLSMAGTQLDVASKGMAITAASGAVTFKDGTCTVAGGSCDMKGFFAGANAGGAGVVYDAYTYGQARAPTEPQSVSASGAAAFVQVR
jgi:hypothetical protein